MAVSNEELNRMRNQLNDIDREIARTREAAAGITQKVIDDNRKKFDDLKRGIDNEINRRDKEVREEYQKLLDASVTEQERLIREKLEKLNAEYEELSAAIRSEEAKRKKEVEELYAKQMDFENAFFAMRDFEKESAGKAAEKAAAVLKEFKENLPANWFRKGRASMYSRRMDLIKIYIDSGMYEASAAMCENLILQIKIDTADIENEFRQWEKNYLTMISLIDDVQSILYQKAPLLTADAPYAARTFGIENNTLTREQMIKWTNGKLEKLYEEFAGYCSAAEVFRKDGVLIPVEELKAFMTENPALSARITANDIYWCSDNLLRLRQKAIDCVTALHSAINAFEERIRLIYSRQDGLIKYLSEEGYIFQRISVAENGTPTETITVFFTDSYRTCSFETVIVPVLRGYDSRWINTVEWYYSSDDSYEMINEVYHIMADVFTDKQILVSGRYLMEQDQTPEDRKKISQNRNRLRINGRTN